MQNLMVIDWRLGGKLVSSFLSHANVATPQTINGMVSIIAQFWSLAIELVSFISDAIALWMAVLIYRVATFVTNEVGERKDRISCI